MDMRPNSKGALAKNASVPLWTKQYTLICIANLVLFTAHYMLMPTIPLYIQYLGGNEVMAGLGTTVFSIAALVVRPFTGWILDHKGRKFITLLGMALTTVFFWGYNLATAVLIVLALRLFEGAAWGIADTSLGTVMADNIPRERFAEGMSYCSATCQLALAMAPAISLAILEKAPYSTVFLVVSCSILVTLFITTLQIKYHPIQKKETTSQRLRLLDLIDRNALKPCMVVVLYSIPYAALMTFIASYGIEKGISSSGFFTFMAGAVVVSRLFLGRCIDRLGSDRVIYLSMPLFFFAPILLVISPSVILFYISAVFFGLGLGIMMPCIQTTVVSSAPPHDKGRATSTYFLAFDVGLALGGVIAGWIAELIGLSAMFLTMTVPTAISAVFYYFCCDKTHRRTRTSLEGESKN